MTSSESDTAAPGGKNVVALRHSAPANRLPISIITSSQVDQPQSSAIAAVGNNYGAGVNSRPQ